MPIDVTMDRPSGDSATPSSSSGPKVICSGAPSGNLWRHRCELPPTMAAKYIHRPSGDHAAETHVPCGPTRRPAELPSNGTNRHGWLKAWTPVISTTSTHRRSGELVRVMRHRVLVTGEVDLARGRTAVRRSHDPHVEAGLDFGEQHQVIGNPRESRRVRQEAHRLAAEHGHSVGVPLPRLQFRIGDYVTRPA